MRNHRWTQFKQETKLQIKETRKTSTRENFSNFQGDCSTAAEEAEATRQIEVRRSVRGGSSGSTEPGDTDVEEGRPTSSFNPQHAQVNRRETCWTNRWEQRRRAPGMLEPLDPPWHRRLTVRAHASSHTHPGSTPNVTTRHVTSRLRQALRPVVVDDAASASDDRTNGRTAG